MTEMSMEEKALEQAQARLGQLVMQTIASIGMDRAELESRIHAAQIDVYRASIAAEESHRSAMLAIVNHQTTPELMKNPQIAQVVEGLRRGINTESDKKIWHLKLQLEEALSEQERYSEGLK